MLKIEGGEMAKRDDMWSRSCSGGGDWETADDGGSTEDVSRTRKLITRITQVCQEIRDMKKGSIKRNQNPPGTDRTSKEPPPDKYETGERDYTHSMVSGPLYPRRSQ